MIKSFWQKSWPHLLAVALFLIVAVVYCKPTLEGKVLQQSDVQQWRAMAQQSFDYKEKHGHFPLWTNSTFGGMPAYQIAMDGPYKFVPSVGYLQYLFTLGLPKPVSFFFLACLMTYLLLMVLRINPWIGMLGALSYAYATYNPVIIMVGHDTKMLCIAYAPAVLAGLFLLFRKKYLWGTLALATFTTLIIGNSHLQIVYYTFLMALFAGVGFAIHCFKNGEVRHLGITLALAAVGALMGLGINANNILPLNEFAKETMRGGRSELTDTSHPGNKSSGGLDKSYAFEYSLSKLETFTLMVPDVVGGGDNGHELGPDSKFAQKLEETFRMPEESAIQNANGSLYWGDQPIVAGPPYVGAILCFLFILGLVLLKDWNKWWLLAVTVFAILLAWGSHFDTFNYFLFDHMPYYNKFRAPTTALVIPQLTFTLMGALVLQQVFFGNTGPEELWKKLKLSGIITGAILALLLLTYFNLDYTGGSDARLKQGIAGSLTQQLAQGQAPTPQVQQQAEEISKGVLNSLKDDRRGLFQKDLFRTILLIGLVFALMWAYAKKKLKLQWALAGIILLGSFDLLQVGRRYLSDDNFIEADQSDNSFAASPADLEIKKDPGFFRVLDETGSDPFVNSRTSYFHNSLGGYSPAKLGLYQDIIDRQLRKGNMNVFNMLNTKYFIVANPANGQPVAQPNSGALGNAWFVKSILFAKNADEEMGTLDKLNTRDSVVVDQRFRDIIGTLPVYDSAASIALKQNDNDIITYQSNANSRQFAVFSEIYYPHGWNAYIDGIKVPFARVDYLLRGMPIPAGKHMIEFRFEPASYYTGNTINLWLNVILSLLILAGIGLEWRKKKA